MGQRKLKRRLSKRGGVLFGTVSLALPADHGEINVPICLKSGGNWCMMIKTP
jgi:hypothetical protein